MNEHIESVSIAVGQKVATLGGGATAASGLLAYSDVIPLYVALAGGVVAVFGFLTSLYFQCQRNDREITAQKLAEKMARNEDRRKDDIANYALKRRGTDK